MIKKAFLSLVLSLVLIANSWAAITDFDSYSYWSNLSGISSGSINDIIYNYLGTLGYTGTINDRLHAYLVDQTGLSDSLSLNDLIYEYFVLGTSGGALTFLGQTLTFNGATLTFNP